MNTTYASTTMKAMGHVPYKQLSVILFPELRCFKILFHNEGGNLKK